jgi:hypothetical protein
MAQIDGLNNMKMAGFEPSSQPVATKGNYVDASTISSIGLQKHEIDETLIKRYGMQGLQGYLQAIGAEKAVGSDEFMHFEERMLHEEFVLPAADDNATGTIAIDDATRTLAITAPLGKQLRVNAVIKFQEADLAGELCIITAKAADNTTITVAPYSGVFAQATNAAKYNAAKFVVIGLEFGKGTKQPTGVEPLVDKVYGRTAIFKESYAVSGSDATQVTYVKVNNPATGKSGYVWYLKGENDTRQRFADYMEAQMMFMEEATGLADPSDADSSLTGYAGLLPSILNDGIEDLASGATAGEINDTTVDAWIDAFDKQRGAKEYTAWCGLSYNMAIDDWMASKNNAAAISGAQNWGAFNNSKDMALNLGFNSFTRAGYTFHKKNYDLFNDRGMGGSLGYRNKALFVPAGVSKDPKSGTNLPALAVRFREANGYSRKMEHWLTGSAVLQNPNSTEDALNCHYRTERGLQVFGANRFMISSI